MNLNLMFYHLTVGQYVPAAVKYLNQKTWQSYSLKNCTHLIYRSLRVHDSSGDDSESETSDTVAKVFNGCPLTPSASNLLILQYSARHNLTQEAVSDLLKLLSIHLPTPNTIPKSLYCFQKKFPSLQYNLKLHYYCSSCLQQVDKKDVVICPNAQCRQSLQNYRALSTFFELPIETQIASLMGRKYIYSDILYYVRS